jgi:hypothetical protein
MDLDGFIIDNQVKSFHNIDDDQTTHPFALPLLQSQSQSQLPLELQRRQTLSLCEN